MKKLYALLFILATSFAFTNAFANTVYVSGYVKNNGVAVANKAVKVWVDSANATTPSCYQVHIKYTNSNGFYSDTLSCNNSITIVKSSIEGCSGAVVTNTTTVNSNFSAESNFALQCAPPTPTCNANYNYSVSGDTVRFYNTSTANANIVSYQWYFGNGVYSTLQNPMHVYSAIGTYTTCLTITSSTGCTDSICKTVTITTPTPTCNAGFQFVKDSINYKSFTFYTGNVTNVFGPQTAVQRIWYFGDGDSAVNNTTSNGQIITHVYANPGTYTVCQKIRTVSGCTTQSCQTIVVAPPAFACTAVAKFTYTPLSSLVKFNSSLSTPGVNDTIISRKWVLGDSSVLTGNVIDPQHQYAQPGIYNVCLTIKTTKGCERTFCAVVTTTNINSNCVPQFTFQKIAPKKVAFNSTMSWVPQGDSIIERKWTFGDGTSLTGAFGTNASPTHQYNNFGIYTVCLKIKTAAGCQNEVCKPVVLQDSSAQPPTTANEPIKILSLYPNPVHAQMATVIWSFNNNVGAELAIYDIYGMKKWSMNKTLLQGNNITVIPVSFLPNGPYFFRVTTTYGVKSKGFYKL